MTFVTPTRPHFCPHARFTPQQEANAFPIRLSRQSALCSTPKNPHFPFREERQPPKLASRQVHPTARSELLKHATINRGSPSVPHLSTVLFPVVKVTVLFPEVERPPLLPPRQVHPTARSELPRRVTFNCISSQRRTVVPSSIPELNPRTHPFLPPRQVHPTASSELPKRATINPSSPQPGTVVPPLFPNENDSPR